jgi:hypothetical protein
MEFSERSAGCENHEIRHDIVRTRTGYLQQPEHEFAAVAFKTDKGYDYVIMPKARDE